MSGVLRLTSVICPAQARGRDIPALARIGDDRHGRSIVASRHANDAAMALRLKRDVIADLEVEHLWAYARI